MKLRFEPSRRVGSFGKMTGEAQTTKEPHGMEAYDAGSPEDLGALSDEQQAKLNQFKVKTRMENERYMRQHPEVDCLISGFLREVLLHQPENIRDFAADHFTKPQLPAELEVQLEERQRILRQNKVLQKL